MGKCSWVAFERGAKTVLTFIFSHVGLCALVLGYSIAGAFLFSWLEQRADFIPFNATEHIERCIDQIYLITERHGLIVKGDLELWRKDIMDQIRLHELNVTSAMQDDRYDKTEDDLEERWNIINSLFYCVTAITTIGYGHISPRTTYGRMVTIVYSLFGIPLMLLCLNNIGDSMASTFRFTYRRIFCCKAQKEPNNLPTANDQHAAKANSEKLPYQPPMHYKPKRKNMLISPPISATIHRGSDLPVKLPSTPSTTTPSTNNASTPSSVYTRGSPRPSHFSPHASPCVELDMNSIVAECAEYNGTPLMGYRTPEPVQSTPCRDYDIIPLQNQCTPSPSPPGASAPSSSHSIPSSPLSKDAPSVWFTEHDHGDTFLTVPPVGDGAFSAQSTRPTSPSSCWVEQNSMVSAGSNGRPWTTQDSTVTWATPLENEEPHNARKGRHKRPAGKTLVVYNTLSGDALKQQTKIQKKMALMRAKKGQLKNDATTVFTDPVSGQPVNGDMLGLNYRPIELEPSDKDTRVPVPLVLLFVVNYLLMGAVLFSSLESWHFTDSLYFCFITLSTIGFGDLVPGNLGYETREAQIKLVALALYLLLGLAVLAMSFSLLQEEVVLKCKAFAQYIGLKDD